MNLRPGLRSMWTVMGIGDVCLNRTVRQVNAALQNTTRKPSQPLLCGTRVDRTQRACVARIQELKQVECLASSNFPQQNTIGPVPQRGFEKVTNGDGGYSVLFSASFEANEVRL